jgi:hypothetical protein
MVHESGKLLVLCCQFLQRPSKCHIPYAVLICNFAFEMYLVTPLKKSLVFHLGFLFVCFCRCDGKLRKF